MSALAKKTNPFRTLLIPNRVIVDMSYPNYSIEDKELDKVRFLLSPSKNPNKPFVLIVIAHDSISPMQYPFETFFLIKSFLNNFSIELDEVEIILDYFQCTGIETNSINGWEFSTDRKGEYLEDKLSVVKDSMIREVMEVRETYYNEFNFSNAVAL